MTEKPEEQIVLLERLLQSVGNNGRFQLRFNVIFNVAFVLFASLIYMNVVLILNVPDHKCHVPGRELTNLTAEEWRSLTLPLEKDNRGEYTQSTCRMYNVPLAASNGSLDYESWKFTKEDIVACQYGYDYDKTWYETTLVSDENWVCDRQLYVTNSFVYHRVATVVGSFIFGQLGDTVGRRPIFYISLLIMVVGRVLLIFTASNYMLFSVVTIFGCLTNSCVFSSPMIIATEVSIGKQRARITMLQFASWTIGLCLLSLLFWVFNEWKSFLLITTLPCIIFGFFWTYMIESPRWLASKGKYKECVVQLNKIARINKVTADIDEDYLLKMFPVKKAKIEKVYGVASLFSDWRIAKNTVLIITCWICCNLSYFTMILNSSKMPGNPFLNFFYQNAAELPAYFVAKYLGDKIGRRWTNIISYIGIGMACVPIILTLKDPELAVIPNLLVALIRFLNSITYFIVYLQAIEIYPTCLRQTGMAMGTTMSNAIGAVGPYIVYLGTAYDVRYPFFILCALTFAGAIGAFFLPETYLQKLPETLAEAQTFGEGQSLWSMPQKDKSEDGSDSPADSELLEKLNKNS